MVIFDGFSEFASHEWPCSVLSSICEPRFGGGPVVVAGEWLYRGAEIHRCSHGASYPYHYHQPPPLHRSVVDSSASTTFSRTPTKSYTATEPLRIVVSSSLFIPSSRESQSVSSSATTFCSSSSSPSSCATTSSSFCVSFVRFLFITELPDALCVSSRYTQLSSAMGSSLGCTVHRYSPRTAPSSHSSLSPPPWRRRVARFIRDCLHRNPRFLMVCSHRPRMSLFEKGTRRRRRRYRWSGFSVASSAPWGIILRSLALGERASEFESIKH